MKRQPKIDIGEDRVIFRQGDRLPGLVMRIVDGFDVPVDLTPFTVSLSTRRISGVGSTHATWGPLRQCSIRDPVAGLIFYDMQPEDTNTNPGEFELIAVIAENGKRVATAPTRPDTFLQVNSHTLTDLIAEQILTVNLDTPVTTSTNVQLVAEGIKGTDPDPVIGRSGFMV